MNNFPVRQSKTRWAAITIAATAALATGAAVPSAAATTPSGAAAAPSAATATPDGFSFADCPALPAPADPHQWRCEVMIATGHLRLGSLDLPAIAPMRITHAEGTLDGRAAEVFGRLRARSTRVGPLELTPRYGGHADFFPHGEIKGSVDLRFGLSGPLLRRGCTTGTTQRPVHTALRQVGPTTVISSQPPIIAFDLDDSALIVPAARDCGPLTGLLNRRAGLPALPGRSEVRLATRYTSISYADLPAAR